MVRLRVFTSATTEILLTRIFYYRSKCICFFLSMLCITINYTPTGKSFQTRKFKDKKNPPFPFVSGNFYLLVYIVNKSRHNTNKLSNTHSWVRNYILKNILSNQDAQVRFRPRRPIVFRKRGRCLFSPVLSSGWRDPPRRKPRTVIHRLVPSGIFERLVGVPLCNQL